MKKFISYVNINFYFLKQNLDNNFDNEDIFMIFRHLKPERFKKINFNNDYENEKIIIHNHLLENKESEENLYEHYIIKNNKKISQFELIIPEKTNFYLRNRIDSKFFNPFNFERFFIESIRVILINGFDLIIADFNKILKIIKKLNLKNIDLNFDDNNIFNSYQNKDEDYEEFKNLLEKNENLYSLSLKENRMNSKEFNQIINCIKSNEILKRFFICSLYYHLNEIKWESLTELKLIEFYFLARDASFNELKNFFKINNLEVLHLGYFVKEDEYKIMNCLFFKKKPLKECYLYFIQEVHKNELIMLINQFETNSKLDILGIYQHLVINFRGSDQLFYYKNYLGMNFLFFNNEFDIHIHFFDLH